MATRFWVGGTGTWDASTTTNWSASTGGAGGASVPGASDTVTLDGASGGGTVTVNTTVNISTLAMGAFTGTLDFSANNNNVTSTVISGSGTGTRTLNMGNGVWTITTPGSATPWNFATTTGLTLNRNSSTISISNGATNTITFAGGSLTWGVVTFSSAGKIVNITGTNTFSNIILTAPTRIEFTPGVTTTIQNAFTFTGSSSNPIEVSSSTIGTIGTISVATGSPTMTWAGVHDLTFTGGATFTATNSLNLGNNTGITISSPSSGGGTSGIVQG